MDELPIVVPDSCSLDRAGAEAQLARYRSVGAGARVIRDAPQELVIDVAGRVADSLIGQLIAVEGACCPFFRIDWAPAERRLSIGVARREEAPALAAIRHALFA